ncbi:CaiB/BaiF CoA transferase family protein [Bordetella bronchiseptica]|uniref:CaiB/BaiF CoA transferase family protein n=1 Tax=Bordetella bronchiseptica TaxID=518 RepID=UPI00081CA5BC|nr:CoA transferase [Bordetella bronchiseptica]AOB25657.1 formyl-CoA transferase [Bordetella bronchiseptica]
MSGSKPLSQIRVLDLSRVRAGPACVRMLADFGADVIRIEPPRGVDPNEAMFAADRMSGDFQNLNRNKRSLTLNLKYPQGREILYKLVETADVVVENWRPDVKARLGLDYETLRGINPRIILASISGYGQSGPYARRPGFDQIIQGLSGLMSITGEPGGKPMRAGLAVADVGAGMYAAMGILMAVIERQRSGQGQWVQASLLHSLIAMLDFQVARYLNEGDVPVAVGNDHPTSSPMGLYQASDGPFNLGSSGEGTWQRLCRILGREGLVEVPEYGSEKLRVRNRAMLNEVLAPIFARHDVQHWVRVLNEGGVPAGPVYTIPQVIADEQVRHLNVAVTVPTSVDQDVTVITQPVVLSRTPAEVTAGAPQWGEHSEAILAELGYQPADLERLRAQGVF